MFTSYYVTGRNVGGWRLGAAVGATLWAIHPMRVEVIYSKFNFALYQY